MFLPVGTDAPVYHWPWVTLSLIVTNIVAFILHAAGILPGGAEWEAWAIHFGRGLRPLEWFTCHFVHFDVVHLLGNMIFLWVFGLVVEGKIGCWRFLAVFFGMGAVQAFLLQLFMLFADDPRPAGGASGVIYGLMAISLVWAPRNEVTLVGLVWYRLFNIEITILMLSVIYFVMQVVFAVLTGFVMSSEILHLAGAAIGLGVGVVMLKRGWVDCENWDLFAVLNGTHGATEESKSIYYEDAVLEAHLQQAKKAAAEYDPERADEALEHMRYCLATGKPSGALSEYRRVIEFDAEYEFERDDLQGLIEALMDANVWNEAGPLLEEFIKRYPGEIPLRLKLAAMLVDVEQRPRYAVRILEGLEPTELDESQLRWRARIERRAQHLIDDGVMELEGRRWE